MSGSSWDDLKRVREEEYFIKEEREKLNKLRDKLAEDNAYIIKTKEAISKFERGFSPISGASFFKSHVHGHDFLDCPEEGSVLMTYDTLKAIIRAAELRAEDVINAWDKYLRGAETAEE